MCNIYTNEHYWVIGSNTSNISAPLVGQPCQCGSVLWGSRPTKRPPDRAKRAAKSKPAASKRSKSGAAGKA